MAIINNKIMMITITLITYKTIVIKMTWNSNKDFKMVTIIVMILSIVVMAKIIIIDLVVNHLLVRKKNQKVQAI